MLKDQWLSASFFIAFILAGASDNAAEVKISAIDPKRFNAGPGKQLDQATQSELPQN